VLHDALTAQLAPVVRECGGHVVLHVGGRAAPTRAVDAYVLRARRPVGRRGRVVVDYIAALVPAADVVTAREADVAGPAPPDPRRAHGWSSVLADVVGTDRRDRVGGRFHARPSVAAR
jgi:hypothetical protein